MIRIGVDVGGTNTDAVLMNGETVVSFTKQPTSSDIKTGIERAISLVLKNSDIDRSQIKYCMIGTTQFTNAFVQRQQLNKVAIIRLGLPSAGALKPLCGWPQQMIDALEHTSYLIKGGHQFDGTVNNSLDWHQIKQAAADIKRKRYKAVAISGIFSPVNNDFEQQVRDYLLEQQPDLAISLSHEIGRIGLIERENSCIMNASLAKLATKVIDAFEQSLTNLDIQAPLFITQNDGTLMNAAQVRKYPVMTFASGPTNSMRGAVFLTGLKQAIVADIGGTTTDIGMLQQGFPRESSIPVDIGGVRTNFQMPDIIVLGLGGGTRIRLDDGITIGPDSVGYELTSKGIIFGGDTLTATDVVSKLGRCNINKAQPERVNHSDDVLKAIEHKMHQQLEDCIDKIKTSKEKIPLILVGGGQILINQTPDNVSELLRPKYAEVANAIGASIGQISGDIDVVCQYKIQGRDVAIASAKQQAIDKAIAQGAIANTVKIVDIQEIPLSYVKDDAVRIKVKATGDLF